MTDLLKFVNERIEDLTQKRKEYIKDNDFEMDDYLAGAIDAYDIVRMKIDG